MNKKDELMKDEIEAKIYELLEQMLGECDNYYYEVHSHKEYDELLIFNIKDDRYIMSMLIK